MTVGIGAGGVAAGMDKAQLGKAIGQGLQRGITQVAIESAAQKAGVDPLTTALTSRAITGALEGFLTSGPKVGDKAGGVMKGIFDAYTNSTLNTLSLGGAPEAGNPYSQAVYASKVKDFGDIVRQRGLPQALETYATGIFTRDSLDSIVKQGGIGDMITGKAKVVPYDGSLSEYKGKNVKLIYTDKGKGEYFVTDLSESAFIGEKKGNVYREGEFGVGPDGKFGLVRGWVNETNADGSTTKLIVTNLGGPEEIILPAEGISIDHLPEKKAIKFNEKGELIDGVLEEANYKITMRDGKLENFQNKRASSFGGSRITETDLDKSFLEIQRLNDKSYKTTVRLNLMSSQERREFLKGKYGLNDQQLDGILNQLQLQNLEELPFSPESEFLNDLIGIPSGTLAPSSSAKAKDQKGVIETIGGVLRGINERIRYAIDYTKSHYFGQSDPAIINRAYNRIINEKISFFNGYDLNPGETTLRNDPNQLFYEDPMGLRRWWLEDEMVIVRYQDKVAAFGEKFFDTLASEHDFIALDDPVVRDTLGRRFNDPKGANSKIENFVSMVDFLNSYSRGIQAFTGSDGVYHIGIERQGVLIKGANDTRHWYGYIETHDEDGNPKRVYIQDKEFLLDLTRKSRRE